MFGPEYLRLPSPSSSCSLALGLVIVSGFHLNCYKAENSLSCIVLSQQYGILMFVVGAIGGVRSCPCLPACVCVHVVLACERCARALLCLCVGGRVPCVVV